MSTCSFMIDSKREEFRKYLENSGVMDKFTEVLTELYESQERPKNVLEFVADKFASHRPGGANNNNNNNCSNANGGLADDLRRAKESLASMKSKLNELELIAKNCSCRQPVVSSSTADL